MHTSERERESNKWMLKAADNQKVLKDEENLKD